MDTKLNKNLKVFFFVQSPIKGNLKLRFELGPCRIYFSCPTTACKAHVKIGLTASFIWAVRLICFTSVSSRTDVHDRAQASLKQQTRVAMLLPMVATWPLVKLKTGHVASLLSNMPSSYPTFCIVCLCK